MQIDTKLFKHWHLISLKLLMNILPVHSDYLIRESKALESWQSDHLVYDTQQEYRKNRQGGQFFGEFKSDRQIS